MHCRGTPGMDRADIPCAAGRMLEWPTLQAELAEHRHSHRGSEQTARRSADQPLPEVTWVHPANTPVSGHVTVTLTGLYFQVRRYAGVCMAYLWVLDIVESVGRRPTLACLRTSAGNGAQLRESMPPATHLAVTRPPAHWWALYSCDFSACSNRLALARCVTSSWTSSTSLICSRPDLSALVLREGDDQLQVCERAMDGRGAI